jgi:signal transduction histidine kinase
MNRGSDARLVALGMAGLLAGIGAVWVASYGSYTPPMIPGPPIDLLVGWSFIGSGLASWRARPDNRLGPLMVGTGFVWFASLLQQAHGSALFTIGEIFQTTYLAGFLYVVLSFPSGRLWTALDRALCLTAVGLVTAGQLAWMLFASSHALVCGTCSANLLDLDPNVAVAHGLLQFQRTAGLAVMVTTIVLLGVRLARASRPQRQAMIPVLLAGIIATAVLTASTIANVFNEPIALTLNRLAGYALAAVPVAVLVAFARRRLARGAVAGLVVELGTPAMDIREALSRALGDPSLTLGYWLPAESRFVDSDGKAIELGSRLPTVVERDGRPIAVLLCDPALEHNAGLVDSVCAAAGLTLENERLKAELRAKLVELQASRARLVEATEAQRRRIERDLHDGTQQRLVSIALSLGLIESRMSADDARPLVHQTREELAAALAELRELSQGIHPTILTERGLAAALDELCRRASLPARLESSLDGARLSDQLESSAYFLVSEALTNAAKHSYASQVTVTASRELDLLTVRVEDDGIGGASADGGSGLRGLADRVEALGGRLSLTSPPGQGTKLRAEFPCG